MSDAPRQTTRPVSLEPGKDESTGSGRIRRLPKHISQPNMTPMIDIVFNLLIFFLCAGNFNQPEGLLPSRLPKQHGLATVGDEIPTTPIRITLQQYGPGENDYAIRIEQRAQNPSSFKELEDILRGLRESGPFDAQTQVIVVAGGNVRWDHLVNAFNASLAARFENITFGTQ